MPDFVETQKATIKRKIGDLINAVTYLEEAWKAPVGHAERLLIREATERLDDVIRELTREWGLDSARGA